MEILKTKDGKLKIRHGSLWGVPRVKIDVSKYEYLINRDKILKGIEEQLDREKWDVSIIGIGDLEPYIKSLQEANNGWNDKYVKLQNSSIEKIDSMKEHFILNAKPFTSKEG